MDDIFPAINYRPYSMDGCDLCLDPYGDDVNPAEWLDMISQWILCGQPSETYEFALDEIDRLENILFPHRYTFADRPIAPDYSI